MFFHIPHPPNGPKSTQPEVEMNINGEPKYLMTSTGELIINDPTLVRVVPEESTTEVVTEPPPEVSAPEQTIQEPS